MASEALLKKSEQNIATFGLLTKNALNKIKKAVSMLEFELEIADFSKDNRQMYYDNEADFLGLERRAAFA